MTYQGLWLQPWPTRLILAKMILNSEAWKGALKNPAGWFATKSDQIDYKGPSSGGPTFHQSRELSSTTWLRVVTCERIPAIAMPTVSNIRIVFYKQNWITWPYQRLLFDDSPGCIDIAKTFGQFSFSHDRLLMRFWPYLVSLDNGEQSCVVQ